MIEFISGILHTKKINYIIVDVNGIGYKILIKFKNPFIHGTLVIKKELLNKVGNYDENFTYAQDYKLYRDLIDRRIKIKKIWKKLYILNTVNNISNIFKSEQSYFANCVRNRKKP